MSAWKKLSAAPAASGGYTHIYVYQRDYVACVDISDPTSMSITSEEGNGSSTFSINGRGIYDPRTNTTYVYTRRDTSGNSNSKLVSWNGPDFANFATSTQNITSPSSPQLTCGNASAIHYDTDTIVLADDQRDRFYFMDISSGSATNASVFFQPQFSSLSIFQEITGLDMDQSTPVSSGVDGVMLTTFDTQDRLTGFPFNVSTPSITYRGGQNVDRATGILQDSHNGKTYVQSFDDSKLASFTKDTSSSGTPVSPTYNTGAITGMKGDHNQCLAAKQDPLTGEITGSHIYVAGGTGSAGTIYRIDIDPATGEMYPLSGYSYTSMVVSGSNTAAAVLYDPYTDFLYCVVGNDNKLYAIDASTFTTAGSVTLSYTSVYSMGLSFTK